MKPAEMPPPKPVEVTKPAHSQMSLTDVKNKFKTAGGLVKGVATKLLSSHERKAKKETFESPNDEIKRLVSMNGS